jgi:hypothetical protein
MQDIARAVTARTSRHIKEEEDEQRLKKTKNPNFQPQLVSLAFDPRADIP